MNTFLLIVFGLVYLFLLVEGYTKGKIRAKGRVWHIRIYERETEPGWYWLTFSLYVVLALMCFGGVLYFW